MTGKVWKNVRTKRTKLTKLPKSPMALSEEAVNASVK